MNKVKVKNCVIGGGIPKICIPIVAGSMRELFAQTRAVNSKNIDIVEWRGDWFDEVSDPDMVRRASRVMRGILNEIPILFTLRSKGEGGDLDISDEDYAAINRLVISERLADMIDLELLRGDDLIRQLTEEAHQAEIPVIISTHDFEKTPPVADMISRMKQAEGLGADILKIAVMPHTSADVLKLLAATNQISNESECPLITMSMGRLGKISRLCGEIFGSSVTFGTVGSKSAPGQVPLDQLQAILNLLHEKD